MWIHEFRKLFDETARGILSRTQNLESVERSVAGVFDGGQIGSSILHAIENNATWDYPEWWPRLSDNLEPPVPIPPGYPSAGAERKLITRLYHRIRHIEVLSVVLRFVFPQQFGILSPPVTHLIALPPRLNHVEYYLDYLHILRNFSEHYGGLRVADVEIALWTAAHQTFQTMHRALVEEMDADNYFQDARAGNLIGDLARRWKKTERYRIMLAKALIKPDDTVSALIAARYYEWAVNEMTRRLRLPKANPKDRQSPAKALVDQLVRSPQIKRWGLSPAQLGAWWKARNKAVHCDREPLTRQETERFVSDMENLMNRLEH